MALDIRTEDCAEIETNSAPKHVNNQEASAGSAQVTRTRNRNPMVETIKLPFSEDQIRRYSRHLLLKEFGGTGQKKIMGTHVLVAGSSLTALFTSYYLVAAGIKTLYICPESRGEDNRTVLPATWFSEGQWQKNAERLQDLNPDTEIMIIHDCCSGAYVYDLIFNLEMADDLRSEINRISIRNRIPQFVLGCDTGETYVDLYSPDGQPCNECVEQFAFDSLQVPSQLTGSIQSMWGAFIAVEALKFITDMGTISPGYRMMFNIETGKMQKCPISANRNCAVCSP